jgi:glycosyltransferase involved in cell wall biosynthesis
MSRPSVLLLSTADWDQVLWTNKQYMAIELSRATDVVYVESLGLRRPELKPRDIARLRRRLRPQPTRPVPEGIRVLAPRVIPYHRQPVAAANRRVLRRLVERHLPPAGRYDVLWTYSPVTYGLERHARVTIYHCVDLLHEFPRVDRRTIEESERRLARTGTLAIASSSVVADHLALQGFRDVIHWPNVGQIDPFMSSTSDAGARGVVFGGNITPHKLDFSIVRALRARLPDERIVFAGPIAEGGGSKQVRQMLEQLEIEYAGVLGLVELAQLYATASVGIVPYRMNAYTAGVDPLKLFEYLAAGIPVVSTPIPAVVERGIPAVRVREHARDFAEAVADLVDQHSVADRERCRQFAVEYSWRNRGEQARALIREVLA